MHKATLKTIWAVTPRTIAHARNLKALLAQTGPRTGQVERRPMSRRPLEEEKKTDEDADSLVLTYFKIVAPIERYYG